jgi:hypothetical protein
MLNVETKEQSKQWMHTHSQNEPKILNQHCLPARKLIAAVFWDGKGAADGGFYATGDHNNIRSVL